MTADHSVVVDRQGIRPLLRAPTSGLHAPPTRLDHHLGQLPQQTALAGQLQPAGAGSLGQLAQNLLICGRQLGAVLASPTPGLMRELKDRSREFRALSLADDLRLEGTLQQIEVWWRKSPG